MFFLLNIYDNEYAEILDTETHNISCEPLNKIKDLDIKGFSDSFKPKALIGFNSKFSFLIEKTTDKRRTLVVINAVGVELFRYGYESDEYLRPTILPMQSNHYKLDLYSDNSNLGFSIIFAENDGKLSLVYSDSCIVHKTNKLLYLDGKFSRES